ncbi:MAG: hypothetical protein HOP08_04395 [Cyclobacteriaceae bacterium]|nr:hypothetical protein [Cyclobacteriaceae bacterium]
MKFRCFVLSVFLAVGAISASGQLNNKVFEDRMPVNEADSGKFAVGLNTLAFFKNNEYTRTIIDGYTLFGFQFQPYVSYHLNKNVRIDAGGYFQKDFGNSKFSTIAPIFSIKWNKNEYSVIFGNLESSLNHRLIEPLYDFERVLNNRLETGVQFQINREDLFVDLWIDWQYMQYWRDTQQEQLVAGLSAQKKILKIGSGSLSVPIQLMTRHQGGQLDIAGLAIQTLVNTAVGLNWSQPINGLVSQIGLNGFYLYDKDLTNSRQAYKDGSGYYLNGTLSTKFGLEVMASYWKAEEFIAFDGGKIYPAVSYFDNTRIQPTPNLMIFRFLYDYKVAENLYLTLRYEPYFDLSYHTFQYSYGVYVNYRDKYYFKRKK